MLNRIRLLRDKFSEESIDALLINSKENKYYLTGFVDLSEYTGVDSAVLVTGKNIYLIVEYSDEEKAKTKIKHCEVLVTTHKITLADHVSQVAEDENIRILGIEKDNIKFKLHNEVTDKLQRQEIKPTTGLVEGLRIIKDEEEIEKITRAVKITDEAFDFILPHIKPGVTEKELALEIEFFMKRIKGAESLAFSTLIASGINSSMPHGTATDKKLAKGDLVIFDFGAKWDGYNSDMTRTVILDKPDKQQDKIYNIVLEAQLAGVNTARAGMKASELDAVARKIIKSYGYGKEFGHELGHGLGLRIHESPMLGDYDHTILEPNMVVTIEPGIYISGWGGVRIEETVVIKENGCRILTGSTKELIICRK